MFDGNTKSYQAPYTISKEMNDILRELKKTTKNEREGIKRRVEYEFPAASPEKVAAITYNRISPKLVHDLKVKQGKNTDFYNAEHYSTVHSDKLRQQSLEKLKDNDNLIYGVDKGRCFKPNFESVSYKNNNSLVRIKELSNSRDKTLIKADFMKTSQSPSSKRLTQIMLNSANTNYPQYPEKRYLGKTLGSSLLNYNNGHSSNLSSTRGSSIEVNTSNPWMKYEYIHPGKWTKLETEKDYKLTGDNRVEAWSCCISTNKNSQVRFI